MNRVVFMLLLLCAAGPLTADNGTAPKPQHAAPPVWIPPPLPPLNEPLRSPLNSPPANAPLPMPLPLPAAPAVNDIAPHDTAPDVGTLSAEERKSLDLACGDPRVVGLAVYRQCVTGQINILRAAGVQPNPNLLPPSGRSSIELACADTQRWGPSLYDRCRTTRMRELHK